MTQNVGSCVHMPTFCAILQGMNNAHKKQPAKEVLKVPALFRPGEIEHHGISKNRLRGMIRRGEVERIERGLYRLASAPISEFESIAMVCARVPGAIICLLTALRVHEIGTQSPREIWIALDRKARKPVRMGTRVRIVRFSGPMLGYGIETRDFQGVRARITSPARTVVDCFRYRNKIGLDVAKEALSDALRSKKATRDEILRAAEACRIQTVIRPYIMAVS
jgi:predicted transcriptional regulator of viral defense system